MSDDPHVGYDKLPPGIRALAFTVQPSRGEPPARVVIANADQRRKSVLDAIRAVRGLVVVPIFAAVEKTGRAARGSPGTVVAGTAAVAVAAAGVAFGVAALASRTAASYGGPLPAATVTVTSGPGSDLTGPDARTLSPTPTPGASVPTRRGPSFVGSRPSSSPTATGPARRHQSARGATPTSAPTATSGTGSVPSSQPHGEAGPQQAQSDAPSPQPSQPAPSPGNSCALGVQVDPLPKVCIG